MSSETSTRSKPPSATQIAEAAAWVAHLHGDKRSADSDRGLQLWLKDDAARKRVWEAATDVWDEVGNLQGAAIAQTLKLQRRAPQARRARVAWAAAAAVLLAVLGLFVMLRDAGVVTGVGEQRTVTLDDGSRVILNTATRVVVHYDARQRRVELLSGEALFEVARQPQRPFIVTAGGQQIRALGTSFVVRRDAHRLAVTLVEGKVAVTPDAGAANAAIANAATKTLVPGQRLTFVERRAPSLDRPVLDKLTAWQHGQVVLEGLSLREAVDEMNRYSKVKVTVGAAQAAQLRVSGVFRAGDSLSFARAVAATYRLQLIQARDRITLAGDPQTAYER
jgi:transmembrane sensor